MQKLEEIAFIGSTDSYGYRVVSPLGHSFGLKKYFPKDIYELNKAKEELTKEIKFRCIFICTSLFPRKINHYKNKDIEIPASFSLLKTLRSEGSMNKNTNIVVIAEKGDERYEKLAKKYGADNYIC